MCLAGSRDFRNAFSDQRLRHDHLRLSVVALLRGLERIEKRLHVVSVDLLDLEAVGFETLPSVFALGHVCHCIERDSVVVVNEDQVIEAEMPGERARLRGNAFLQTAVARETNHVLVENHVLGGVEPRRGHLRRHRHADGIRDALPERPGSAFHARRFKKLRMPRRLAVQLPELLDLFHRQIVSAQVEPGVKEHAAVSGRQNEIIAPDPARLFGIMLERIAVKDGAHLGASQRQAEVARLRSLHRVHGQSAGLIRRARKNFEIQTHDGYNWRIC